MKKWIIGLVIIALVGWAVYDFAIANDADEELAADTGLEKGNLAPDFELNLVNGETVKLSDFRGEKVVLNFWATWCPPCRAEMPDLQKYHEENDDAVILAVNLTETEKSQKNVDSFLEEYGITFNVLADENTIVANLYNAHALPTTYFIDSEGKVYNMAQGPVNYDMIKKQIDSMN